MNFIKFIWHIPRLIAQGIIELYQKVLSPDHSFWAKDIYPHGYCKFTPTCSDYGKATIKKYGFIRGSFKTLWRIAKCNPWTEGGQDLP